FNFEDSKMCDLFEKGGNLVTRALVSDWLKREEDPAFKDLSDRALAEFLNGLIIEKRGKKDDTIPIAEDVLNNNIILRKLKIALNLKDEDILAILQLADFRLSKHELSAFFRQPNQSQYRACQDQIMRNFLHGLEKKYHAS
ncbi:MAG: DUF1456 family protein, partial [Chitinophagales bacterium]|nr:DUF1456 family protein [Chitinophagales bacterium]